MSLRRWLRCARFACLAVLPMVGGCNLSSALQPLVRLGFTDWPGNEYFYLAQQRVWLMPGGWMETTVRRMAQRLQAAGRLPRAMPLPQVTSRWAGGDGGP